jgi:hypothetical protein
MDSADGQHAELSGERLRAIPRFREVELQALQAPTGRFALRSLSAGTGPLRARRRRREVLHRRTLDAAHFHAMVEEPGAPSKIATKMALGRSLSTICSVGRRRRRHPVWLALTATTCGPNAA